MSKPITRSFRITIKVKDCAKEFSAGMGAGVLATKDIEYTLKPEEFARPMFLAELCDQEQSFLEECIEITTEVIPESKP